jgi:hypothetical protein
MNITMVQVSYLKQVESIPWPFACAIKNPLRFYLLQLLVYDSQLELEELYQTL